MSMSPERCAELMRGEFAAMKERQMLRWEAANKAREAMPRLITCAHQTGQSYKIRDLLYSLWNGQKTAVIELLGHRLFFFSSARIAAFSAASLAEEAA